mmetsp:Transcript_12354/g.35038  ORF Transcript_12354/g.35038 Transcript_12354/m.35038 type:complete len:783 (+) Transcript_12354:43-2391(+)
MGTQRRAMEGYVEWFLAVGDFHRRWFPSSVAIQHFWFGARKQSLRTFFDQLISEHEASLEAAACAATLQPMGIGGAWATIQTGGPPRAFARLQLRAAIFLDQMSRNIASVRGESSPGVPGLRTACDAAALPLAMSALADAGGPDSGTGLLALGTPAELCFLSLVLRHSRQPELIALSLRMLLAVSAELSSILAGDDLVAAHGICERFILETQDAAQAVKVEAYLATALTADEPLSLVGPPEGVFPRLEVLDARCQRQATAAGAVPPFTAGGADLPFLAGLLDPTTRKRFEGHAVVDVLRRSLQELGLLSESRGLVLSLSGGVDSMVTCCLLWLLHQQLPPAERFRWCAIHLCHPNRSDSLDEEGWVRWACNRLGVNLFTYRLQIRRPHGNLRTGISRERYEEKSKELRFRMYERCLVQLGVGAGGGAALVAHHQDDADENRLAELGKGNILHIDGMSMRGVMLGVEVVRPLLLVRKAELLDFAEAASVCYMQDSTPKWSRRGWIRRVLDGLGVQDADVHRRLLELLSRAGALSEALGEELDASLLGWKQRGIVPGTLTVAACSGLPTSNPASPAMLDLPVVALHLPELLELAGGFGARLAALCAEFAGIAEVWNTSIDKQNTVGAGDASAARSDLKLNHVEEDCCNGMDGEGEGLDDAPGACPLQKIRVGDEAPSAGPFLLGRAIAAASNHSVEVQRLVKGQLATRRALTHLWDCIARARREHQWGTLHKKCPCLYLHAESCLVLCDMEGRDREFADRSWQRSFAAAAAVFVSREGTVDLSK